MVSTQTVSSTGYVPPVSASAPVRAVQADKVTVKPDSDAPVHKMQGLDRLASQPEPDNNAPRGSILDILA